MKLGIANLNKNSIVLAHLTNYSEKKGKIARMMVEEYKSTQNENWLVKASLTLVNSIITQNRKVFILNRESLTKLLANDVNHKDTIRLDNTKYKRFISYITKDLLTINKIKRNQYYVMVCAIKWDKINKILSSDYDTQYKEVMEFVTGEIIETRKEIELREIDKIKTIVKRYIDIKSYGEVKQNKSFRVISQIKSIMARYESFLAK